MRSEPPGRAVLLSVKPRFAAAILNGSKTVEIRRRAARLPAGTTCLLYSTSPQCAIVGTVVVEQTITADADTLWDAWGPETALDRDEYDAYLTGSQRPCAIVIGEARALRVPIDLSELRRRHAPFVTPQSYRFLPADELARLLKPATPGRRRLLARPRVSLGLG